MTDLAFPSSPREAQSPLTAAESWSSRGCETSAALSKTLQTHGGLDQTLAVLAKEMVLSAPALVMESSPLLNDEQE